MIIREIKQNPDIIDNFDWFNDYTDTRNWTLYSCPELVERLDEGYMDYKLNEYYKFIKKVGCKQ